jgi:hypothetical protein
MVPFSEMADQWLRLLFEGELSTIPAEVSRKPLLFGNRPLRETPSF